MNKNLFWTNVRTLWLAFIMKVLKRCPMCYHKMGSRIGFDGKTYPYCSKCWGN